MSRLLSRLDTDEALVAFLLALAVLGLLLLITWAFDSISRGDQ